MALTPEEIRVLLSSELIRTEFAKAAAHLRRIEELAEAFGAGGRVRDVLRQVAEVERAVLAEARQ